MKGVQQVWKWYGGYGRGMTGMEGVRQVNMRVQGGMVCTRTGKPGKMGRHFPVKEKSGNFKQTGKVREDRTKYWKTQGNLR